jgi:2-dehydro-3-deoxyphosphogluconate aldolase/(4S)-4-hydroxy-2-oxoglutarate aldolase
MPPPAHDLGPLIAGTPVMPIVSIHERATAVDLAHALVEGGVRMFEILLRTPDALDAIADIRRQVPQATVGAGTVLGALQVQQALDAGAQFGVSPGLTAELAQACLRQGFALLPGVATPGEVMFAISHGFETVKLFPAHGLLGLAQIEAMQGVFPRVRFCPTGGIKPEHIARYLALRACPMVGGSWVTPQDLLARRDFAGITALARQAAAFASARAA